jgi:hypothetical protein
VHSNGGGAAEFLGAVVEQAEIQVTAASVRIVAILIVFSTSMDG